MSGPKDFTIVFDIARRLEIEARRRAERAAREAAMAAHLAEQRRLAEKRMAEMAARRAEAQKQQLAAQAVLAEGRQQAAKHNMARLASSQDAIRRKHAESLGTQSEVATGHALPQIEPSIAAPDTSFQPAVSRAIEETSVIINELASSHDEHAQAIAASLTQSLDVLSDNRQTTETPSDQATTLLNMSATERTAMRDRAQKVPELIRDIVCWQEELLRDEAVAHFCGENASAWQSDARALLEEHQRGQPNDKVMKQCEQLLGRANEISKAAGDKQGAYATRNELLSDVIESLQEIGFFVSDPQFENPNDPAGPVSLKATRGGEEVSASIDLTDTIRSTWDGVADEHCKDSFFRYVDQMKARGVEVKPKRSDLQDRPQLKQSGARSLPGTESQRRST